MGPKEINVEADFTSIWLGCHAWVEPRSRWSGQMAIDALKALQGWVIDRGFQEGEFDVTGAESWMASCRLLLHAPYPGRSGAILIL